MKLKLLDASKARAFGTSVEDTTTEALIQKFTERWHDAGRAQAHVNEAIQSKAYMPLEDWEVWYAEQQVAAKALEREAARQQLEDALRQARLRVDEAEEAFALAGKALEAFDKAQEDS